MLDALELAETIVQNQDNLSEAIKTFEERMLARATEAAEGTQANQVMMFAADAPTGVVNFFKSMGPPQ
jgi:2-polyprenyl-6-methoxyphenol hydroxylase-like FAD-dependent oxidoreductase